MRSFAMAGRGMQAPKHFPGTTNCHMGMGASFDHQRFNPLPLYHVPRKRPTKRAAHIFLLQLRAPQRRPFLEMALIIFCPSPPPTPYCGGM